MEIFGYFALIGVGLLLGFFGGGGSILSVPILVYLFAEDVVISSAYSLFIVGIASLVGTIGKYKANLVDIRIGLLFGIPSIVGIFSTRKWIIPAIPDIIFYSESFQLTKRALILGIFASLMILSSIITIRGIKNFNHTLEQSSKVHLIFFGLFTGFLTGMVGVGGGFIIITFLILFTKLSFNTAVGTALFIIAINSLIGFMGDVINYVINWAFLITITILAIIGILLGNKYHSLLPSKYLQKTFGWFTLIIGTGIFMSEILF